MRFSTTQAVTAGARFVAIALCFVGLAGCNLLGGSRGSLSVTVQPSHRFASRTLEPAVSMTPSEFDIMGAGPAGASFRLATNGATPVDIKGIAVGAWSVQVAARNADGVEIGSGFATADVGTEGPTNVSIIVVPLDGTGRLTLTMSWPSSAVKNPEVSGTLTPVNGTGGGTPLDFPISGASATYSTDSLATGYYVLDLRLLDASAAVWGGVEVVRIVANQATTGSFALSAADLDPLGGITARLLPELDSPITVSLSGEHSALAAGEDMTVRASVAPTAPPVSYQWYLDSALLSGQTAPEITIGKNLAPGGHRLDVVAVGATAAGSATAAFRVSTYTAAALSKAPVLVVPGYDESVSALGPLVDYLTTAGNYPTAYVQPISLEPTDGANIPAAENQIAPAVDRFLASVNAFISANDSDLTRKLKVDIIAHSMGALSSRWYVARIAPEKVRRWVSIAGANHGTDDLCGLSGAGAAESCPAFAGTASESAIQFALNGGYDAQTGTDTKMAARLSGNTVDETPYGLGGDSPSAATVPPDAADNITYFTIRTSPDAWISPDSSAMLDGAGGIPVKIPTGVQSVETTPGNFLMNDGATHVGLLTDPEAFRLLDAILSASQE